MLLLCVAFKCSIFCFGGVNVILQRNQYSILSLVFPTRKLSIFVPYKSTSTIHFSISICFSFVTMKIIPFLLFLRNFRQTMLDLI